MQTGERSRGIQRRWTHKLLQRERSKLSSFKSSFYPSFTSLLHQHPDWVPYYPVRMFDISLSWWKGRLIYSCTCAGKQRVVSSQSGFSHSCLLPFIRCKRLHGGETLVNVLWLSSQCQPSTYKYVNGANILAQETSDWGEFLCCFERRARVDRLCSLHAIEACQDQFGTLIKLNQWDTPMRCPVSIRENILGLIKLFDFKTFVLVVVRDTVSI